ncbi:MAG TPA: hypothetical protein ENJ41_00505, partial [Oceanospirillales bacterium]|nr:hypothetical protein [Oceanospirillales bacterium]
MKKITSMCLSLLVVQSALALDLTTIKQQNNKSVVTSMDASFNTSISTLSYRDAAGSSLHSIDLDLSMFTQDCLANSDTAGACTLDDELIWEAFSYQTLLPFLPVAASDNQIDANAIESCRSEIGVVMNATWQMCIPKLHVAGDDQDYWAILDLDRSIEGRVFFRLQAHGLVTEATWIDNATDGTVDAGQTYVTGVNYITSHWQFLDHSIAREVRQQEHIIYLDITNTANVDLLIKPKILFDLGNVQRLGKYLPQQRILAKDDSLVEIDLDSFGYSFEQMLYSGAIALVLEVSDANSGVFLENITPEI